MTHRAAQPWEPVLFDGDDETYIVDFKFSNSPKVTWWFGPSPERISNAGPTPEQIKKHPGAHMF